MDIPLDDIIRFLTPLLPYLFRAGERAAEEAGRRIAGDTWDGLRSLWARARNREPLRQAAQDLTAAPDDPDALAAFRFQLRRALAEDPALAEELAALWKAREVHVYIHHLPPPVPERPRPLHNLPQPDYVRFVGREKELAWLRQRLSPNDPVWLLLLTGIGGVGKTALALAIAHEYRARYNDLPPQERFDAIVWASAKEQVLTPTGAEPAGPPGLVSRTLAEVYRAIAQALDREAITRAAPEDQDREVQKALTAQRTLLVLDNLDTMDDAVRAFLRYLPPPTKAIVTSREWLNVADVLTVRGMEREEALALIEAEAEPRGLALTPEQKERLYERTAGLPLPIRLSVARLGSGETFEGVTRWLGDATGDLPQYCVGGQVELARRRNPDAYRLLLACSLFDRDAGASREALGVIADLSIADRDEGLALLERLNLVNRSASDRFWMLPIVQEYVQARLEGDIDLKSALSERWVLWYLEQTTILQEELANAVMVLDWLNWQSRFQQMASLFQKVCEQMYSIGQWDKYLLWLQTMLEQVQAGSIALQLLLPVVQYGIDIFGHRGDFKGIEQTVATLEHLATSEDKASPEWLEFQGRALRWMATGDATLVQKAIEGLQKLIARLQHWPSHPAYIEAMNSLGLIYLQANQIDQAAAVFQRALEEACSHLTGKAKKEWGAVLKGNLAIVAGRKGKYVEARDGVEQILEDLPQMTDQAEAAILLAVYEYHLGNIPKAREWADRAEYLLSKLEASNPLLRDFEYRELRELISTGRL